ncbi:uncharacterized mitochondrial protein AtMg00860-like [Salmo salar]|uniref:ribonuclease H n=1 Tax=Salmo salar TaxID=8030 RepID=A0A1S3Q1D0_SALSA|nr:uncharacterized mitochondrial protein AtMg00860-like [Salmo salar]|eukprot:XP_014033778.1 PREDICTED: uncharacterized mitochondrial protein AtMg00860-like [Salmo salar]
MINQFLIVYIDDILIYSHSLAEYVQHVQQVLQWLQDHHLYVKAEKSAFHVTTVTFLGFELTPGLVNMDEDKDMAVLNWPKHTTIKELQLFLGFSNYYCWFIQNCSSTTAPLSALTSQINWYLQWTDTALTAFETLKCLFTSAPILRQPDPTLAFVLEVDASEVFSKKLSPAERNYDVGN